MKRFIKFACVGGSGFIVNIGVVALTKYMGISDWACLIMAIAVGMLYTYSINYFWTFKDYRNGNYLSNFKKYIGTLVFDAISFGLTFLIKANLSIKNDLPLLVASYAIAIGVIAILRYIVVRKFIWRASVELS